MDAQTQVEVAGVTPLDAAEASEVQGGWLMLYYWMKAHSWPYGEIHLDD